MAPRVLFLAPTPVKVTNVTYLVEHVIRVNLERMGITVIYRVQPIVKTTNVTHRTEHVLNVNLDGSESIVIQVELFFIHIIKI